MENVIRPAMEAVIRRLRADGGDGLVVVDPPNVRGRRRVVLWMSLDGPLVGDPRQDHNPFLQLDADTVNERVDIWEGDLVHQEGVSRDTGSWTLDEVTAEAVETRVVDILRRLPRATVWPADGTPRCAPGRGSIRVGRRPTSPSAPGRCAPWRCR